jgi:hypothetical protein
VSQKSLPLIRAGAWFHKAEVVSVVSALLVGTWGVVRAATDMTMFAVFRVVVCIAAAGVSLWPRVPRGVTIYAEALLLLVALGQWVAPHHDLLPLLGREIRDVEKWNQLALTQRRIIAWNVVVAVSLFWLSLPYVVRHMRISALDNRETATAGAGVFLIIWGLLAFILIEAARLLLS